MKNSKMVRRVFGVVALLAGLLAIAVFSASGQPVGTAAGPLEEAWAHVRAAGSYRFTSDVTQTTSPTASVLNVGHTSKTDQIYMEGRADVDAAAMEFRLWSSGGSLLQEESSLAVRVADGKTYTQQNAGEWQESSDFTQAIAPAGDYMSYLVAARDVTDLGQETRAGLTFTRYAFRIDGPTFALSMRQQIDEAMRQKGDVPPGVTFEVPAYYSDMIGSGELWVGEDGLPIRQILSLQFPEQNNETVSAHIAVDFSQFGQASGAAASGPGTAGTLVPSAFGNFTPDFGLIATGLLAMLLLAVLVHYRRERRLQQALSIALIVSIVGGPVLSNVRMTRFLGVQTVRAAELDQQQVEADLQRVLTTQTAAATFDPHQDQRATVETSTLTTDAAAPALYDASLSASPTQLVDNGTDTDGDGLTDFVEARIGTNPNEADSDGDTLRDDLEVNGFMFGGQMWYTDPNQADSNSDGIADILEWDTFGDNQPDDTDGDGVPDLFDTDNDRDGVPDHMDLAPFSQGPAVYSAANPMSLQVQNLSTGAPIPTFVDFQLRPVDTDQLWFAFNVLDWPQDREGQIRDVDNAPEDMRVVPLLEIRIPDGASMLPPASDLAPYGITVSNLDAATGEQAVYVPLSLITDQQSGERVAFGGRMRYLPQAGWGAAHTISLVWAVVMKNDMVCDPEDAAAVADGCGPAGYLYNQPQVIHRYYEDWRLTGISVTEEHGADIALIYEDPAVDPALGEDAPTWAMSDVLGNRFLTATDDGAGGFANEVTLANMEQRFDRVANGAVAEAPYGLPNIFRVEKAAYTTFDQAVIQTAGVETSRVLATNFDAPWAQDNALMPLVMMAYTTQNRSLNLDSSLAGPGYAAFNGNLLTFDLHPSGQETTPLDTLAGLKWSSYCGGSAGAPTWEACSVETVWDNLDARYGDHLLDPNNPFQTVPTLDADIAGGQNVVMGLYALTLMQGVTSILQRVYGPGDVRMTSAQYEAESDASIVQTVRTATSIGDGVKFFANIYFWRNIVKVDEFLAKLNQLATATRFKAMLTVQFDLGGLRGAAIGAGIFAVAVTVIGLGIAAIAGSVEAMNTLSVLFTAVAALSVVNTIYTTIQVMKSGLVTGSVLALRSTALGFTRTATAIGAIIAVAVTWGFFIYGIAANNVNAFSPEFNQALSETIAATIFIVFLTVLSLTVVGLIIVGIIALIDAILLLVCEIGKDDSLRADFVDGGCLTLSGAAIKGITALLYAYDLMVDVDAEDLVTTGMPTLELVDAAAGYVVGNGLSVQLPITTTIVHKDPDDEDFLVVPYMWFFSKENLRSTTFKYSLTAGDGETLPVALDQMTASWNEPTVDHKYLLSDMYGTQYAQSLSVAGGIPFDASGLNRTFKFYLNTGYALPAFECWMVGIPPVPPFPVCYTRAYDGDSSDAFDDLHFDVLPTTLAGFMERADRPGGRRGLAWDVAFPALRDADGDGALGSAHGGLDPNDATWDTDKDGLSDGFELEQQEAGLAMSPSLWDSDGDGLTDAQEMQIGSNPGIADTDNDGLSDGEEVRHLVYTLVNNQLVWNEGQWAGGWAVNVNGLTPLTVQVSSNPLITDSDGDGISDGAERQLAQAIDPVQRVDEEGRPYHPGVFNTPPIAIYLTTDDYDSFVRPGQAVTLTTEVVAHSALAPSLLDVTLPAVMGSSPAPYLLAFDPLTFSGAQTVTQQTALTVPEVSSQSLSLDAGVRARLAGSAPAPMTWDPIDQEAAIARPNQYGYVSAVARQADRTDSYLLGESSSTSSGTGGSGDVRNIPLPSGGPISLDLDTDTSLSPSRPNFKYLRGDEGPGIACNDQGNCMTVWEHYDNCGQVTINWIRVVDGDDDNSAANGIEPGIYIVRDTGMGREKLWFTGDPDHGGNDMFDGEQRGPNANGFPVTTPFCGDNTTLDVLEIDGNSVDLDSYEDLARSFEAAFESNVYAFTEETARTNTTLQFSNSNYREVVLGAGFVPPQCWHNGYHCNRVDINITIPARQHHKVAGAVTNGSGGTVKSQFEFGSTVGAIDRNPVIASDGVNFLVVWERVDGSRHYIMEQSFDANGAARSPANILPAQDADISYPLGTVELGVIWIGDRYRIVWKDAGRSGSIFTSHAGQAYEIVSGATAFGLDTFDLAYDPIGNRTLLVYLSDSGANNSIIGKVFEGASNLFASSHLLFSGQSNYNPRVAFNPITRGWFVSARGMDPSQDESPEFMKIDALDAALQGQGSRLFNEGSRSTTLACPAWTALPVLDLRFEELPGATTFTDASGYGRHAICSGDACPVLGLAGAAQAPLSDFALAFGDGGQLVTANPVTDQFTLAFWYKADLSGSSPVFTVGAGATGNGYGLTINNTTGAIEWHVAGTTLADASTVNDGDWHFVAATRDAAGALSVYVDGSTTSVVSGASAAPVIQPILSVGGGGAELDHLTVYAVALSGTTLNQIYNRTQQRYCVAAADSFSNNYPWTRLTFSQADPRGGRLAQSAALLLRVDDDLPTSQASVLPNQEAIQGSPGQPVTVTVIIGGSATDATSGIAQVEVSVDGGVTWKAASGAESWAYALAVTDGEYNILTRATDAVGNVEAVGAATVLHIDGIAPAVTLNAPPDQPVAPGANATTGQLQISLSGMASDAGSGVGEDGVQVQLIPAGVTPTEQGWQTASYANGVWSIDYLFSATSADVSGSYAIRVRAVDAAGNRTANDAATGVITLDGNGPLATLSRVDQRRLSINASVPQIGGQSSDLDGAGIATIEVALTPIQTVATTAPDSLPQFTWNPATLTQSGPGITQSDWSFPIPAGLENNVQIDLRTTDMAGNQRILPNVWRGVIDNLAPRLTLIADPTGQTSHKGSRFEFSYACIAEDLFLHEPKFDCPGQTLQTAVRSFNEDPVVQSLFPGLTVLTRLENVYTKWERSTQPNVTLAACDLFGNCATQNSLSLTRSASALVAPRATTTLSAAVVEPTQGQHVAADSGEIGVVVSADAVAFIQTVTLYLDGVPVDVQAFAENAKKSSFDGLIPVSVSGEITHSLKVEVKDWASATQQSNVVAFFLDTAPPLLTLDTSLLTAADNWTAGSNVLQFHGTVSDGGTIAAVQIKVNDAPWVDVAFDATSWQTAIYVPFADGAVLSVGVRAFDLAGHMTEISGTSQVDLTPLVEEGAPAYLRADTAINSGPGEASVQNSNSATFEFAGIDGINQVALLTCRLDVGESKPCSSPWTISDLAAGLHTFHVTAVDSLGAADLSPASRTWTVNPSGPQASITTGPANPASDGMAEFIFAGDSGATFACALDSGVFASCTSPQKYSGLGAGNHTFQVRATVGGVSGTATVYSWHIVNAAPVAFSQVIVVAENDQGNQPMVLVAEDSDSLTYRIVNKPAHGHLDGTPPNLVYVPFSDYYGPDSFTFWAFDGQSYSNLATVYVTVRMGEFVIYGDESVALGNKVIIASGSVGVNRGGPGSFLEKKAALSIGESVQMRSPASRVVADSIAIKSKARVYNPAYNTLDNKGTIWGTATTPLAVPVQPLPALPADFAPGTENVNVPQSTARQLAAGTYGTLVAGKDATVVLSGGLYHFQSWELDAGTKVYVQRATEIRVAGRVLIGKESHLGPDPSVETMTADEVVLYVAGANGKKGEIKDEPAAVDLGEKGEFRAYIVAPNGTILLGENASATGSLIGRWVDVLSGVSKTGEVGAAQAVDAPSTVLSNADSDSFDIPTAINLFNTTVTSTPDGVRVAWESAIEVDVVGFYLVRAGTDDIEERITAELIPAQWAGQAAGGGYAYLDTIDGVASAGASYMLDVLLFDGQVQRIELGQAATYNHQIFLPTTSR